MKAFHAVIMVGVPGSGKSTLVKNLDAVVCSADDYHIGLDGVYKFDPSKAAMAHSDCFNKFLNALAEQQSVVVDNTNISIWERQNYEAAASLAGAMIEYHVFVCDTVAKIKLCAQRNVHAVPVGVIADMACRFDFDECDVIGNVTFHEIEG